MYTLREPPSVLQFVLGRAIDLGLNPDDADLYYTVAVSLDKHLEPNFGGPEFWEIEELAKKVEVTVGVLSDVFCSRMEYLDNQWYKR